MDAETEDTSPFLPGTFTQFAIDSTSLGWLKTCPRLYQYKMVERWRDKEESVHLRFGLEYHEVLQDYAILRNENHNHEEALHVVVSELLTRVADWNPDHKYKNRRNLFRTIIDYLDKYKNDPARTHIMENGYPAVELSFRFELPFGPVENQPYLLCGHLDRVVNFNDDLYVMDRKTTKSTLGDFYFSQYEPDNQMTLYAYAGEIVLHTPVRGIIIDAASVKIDESTFGRGMTYRDKAKIDEWLKDLGYWLSLAQNFSEQNYWPMNDKACNSYRSEESGQTGCPFREACSTSPHVRERILKSNFVKGEQWTPLKTR